MKHYYTLFLLLIAGYGSAQNEFYIKGDNSSSSTEVYVKNALPSMPTLYVKGSVTNNKGIFVNDLAKLEVTKDFANSAVDPTLAYYTSTGEEKFTGADASTISGNLQGAPTAVNNFNQLKVFKATTSTYVNLANDLHVKNLVDINSGIVRTDVSSFGHSGGSYKNILFLMNSTPDSLRSATSGATNYVEGKLKRTTVANTYFFPIGAAPTSYDGMEPVSFKVNSGSGDVLGYIDPATYTYSDVIFQDIGKNPAPGFSAYPTCLPGRGGDGVLDAFPLSNDFPQAWYFTNPSGGAVANYDITVQPGALLDATETYTSLCDTATSPVWRYLLKNGIPGGDGHSIAAGPSSVYTSSSTTLAAFNGVTLTPTGNTLSGQTSFSQFRLHGPGSSGGALPVTYLYLTAKPVENTYIQLDWATGSERDNSGFDIERSEDGRTFKKIGFMRGSGTTTVMTTYTENDYNVVAGTNYYYRLKQQDYNGRYEYSNIVSAKLTGDVTESVNVYPNPNTESDQLTIDIVSGSATVASVKIYDVVGKLVMNEKMSVAAGYNSNAISKTNLATGTYTVSVVLNEKVITQKINVIR